VTGGCRLKTLAAIKQSIKPIQIDR